LLQTLNHRILTAFTYYCFAHMRFQSFHHCSSATFICSQFHIKSLAFFYFYSLYKVYSQLSIICFFRSHVLPILPQDQKCTQVACSQKQTRRHTSFTKFFAILRRTSGAIFGTRSEYSPMSQSMLARAIGTVMVSVSLAM